MIAAVTRSIGVFKTTVAVLRAVEMDSGISRGAQRHIAASFCSAEASTGHHPRRGRHSSWISPRRGVSNLDWSPASCLLLLLHLLAALIQSRRGEGEGEMPTCK